MRRRLDKILSSTVIPVFLILSMTVASFGTSTGTAATGKAPELSCEAAYVLEANTGAVIYEKNSDERLYPASTTKLMTALLAVEYIESGQGSEDDSITFSHDAVFGIDQGTSNIGITVGEQLSVLQVLYAMMLPSANEACLGMGEYVAGTKEDFVEKMNERAAQLGMTGTHFVTTNGLHDDEHYSNAKDLALLMNEAIKHELLVEVMSAASYVIPPTNKISESRHLVNTNKLIVSSSEYYDSRVVCGKTGYTTPAGNVLVTYSKVNGMGVITVLMKAEQGTIFTDTSAVLDYCSESFSVTKVDNLLDYAVAVPTGNGGAQIMACPADSFYVLTESGDQIKTYTKTYDLPDRIEGAVAKGDLLGTLTFYNGDKAVGKVDLVSLADYNAGSETVVTTAEGEQTQGGKDGKASEGSAFVRIAAKLLLIILILVLVFAVIYAIAVILSVSSYNKKRKLHLEKKRKLAEYGGVPPRGPEPYGGRTGAEKSNTVNK